MEIFLCKGCITSNGFLRDCTVLVHTNGKNSVVHKLLKAYPQSVIREWETIKEYNLVKNEQKGVLELENVLSSRNKYYK